MLSGLTVIEYADETAEYCGLLLAGLGAEVIKIEPPGGALRARSRHSEDDKVDKERSLYFWAYNRGKRSVVLDLEFGRRESGAAATHGGRGHSPGFERRRLNQQLGLDARIRWPNAFPLLSSRG